MSGYRRSEAQGQRQFRIDRSDLNLDKVFSEFDPEHRIEIRLLIPAEKAGRIIGKGGENAKLLRNQHNINFNIPDAPGPERIITITGGADNVISSLGTILPKLQKDKSEGDEGHQMELRYLVHKSQAGAVIGTSGSRIKQLRDLLYCNIRCFPACCPNSTDRVVRIAGAMDNILKSLRVAIYFCLRSPPKGEQLNYDPSYFDPEMVNEYGGVGSKDEPSSSRNQNRTSSSNARNQSGYSARRFANSLPDQNAYDSNINYNDPSFNSTRQELNIYNANPYDSMPPQQANNPHNFPYNPPMNQNLNHEYGMNYNTAPAPYVDSRFNSNYPTNADNNAPMSTPKRGYGMYSTNQPMLPGNGNFYQKREAQAPMPHQNPYPYENTNYNAQPPQNMYSNQGPERMNGYRYNPHQMKNSNNFSVNNNKFKTASKSKNSL